MSIWFPFRLGRRHQLTHRIMCWGSAPAVFFAYPLLDRLIEKQYRTGFLFIASLIAVSCIFMIQQHISYLATLISGSMLFLLFGIFSGKVYDMSARALGENRCLARLVGISYAFGILLQFVNNNLINSELAEAIVLSGFLSMLVIFFMRAERARRNFAIPHQNLWQEAEAAPARIKGSLASRSSSRPFGRADGVRFQHARQCGYAQSRGRYRYWPVAAAFFGGQRACGWLFRSTLKTENLWSL